MKLRDLVNQYLAFRQAMGDPYRASEYILHPSAEPSERRSTPARFG